MEVICEMYISEFFKLSSGDVALVGRMSPNIDYFVPNNSKADLYIAGQKAHTLNILGEDRFSGVNEAQRQGKRALKVNDCDDLCKILAQKDIKLVIYRN